MRIQKPVKKTVSISKTTATDNSMLYQLAFNNSMQANIIITSRSEKIIVANKAAYTLLSYSENELLTKKRFDIFDTTEESFAEMLYHYCQLYSNDKNLNLQMARLKSIYLVV